MSVYVGVVYDFLNNRSGNIDICEVKTLVEYLLSSKFNMDLSSSDIKVEDRDFEQLNYYVEKGDSEDLFIQRLNKIARYNFELNGGEKDAT
jgi:hypothetical protein